MHVSVTFTLARLWNKDWKNSYDYYILRGRGSPVGIATGYGLDDPRDRILVGSEISRTSPDRPWGRPSLLYNGYRVFPGGKEWLGRGIDHPLPYSAEVKERVKVYLYSPSGPSWLLLGWTLTIYSSFLCTRKFRLSWKVYGIRNQNVLWLTAYKWKSMRGPNISDHTLHD
jgi:hypothetical protein